MSKFARNDSIYSLLSDIDRRITSLERVVTNTNFVQSTGIIRGVFNTGTPTIISGSNYTLAKVGTGQVEIHFPNPFTDIPTVIAIPESGAPAIERGVDVYFVDKAFAGVYRWDASTDTATDGLVHFIALGSI